MRALLQRVTEAGVTIEGEAERKIGPGLAILLGITHEDGPSDVEYLADKIIGLRVFDDDAGRMNRSLEDTGGEALIVSQFTLYGDARRGRRPSYTDAARPETAVPLYDAFVQAFRDRSVGVDTGEFGARMSLRVVNDGPVTLMLESPSRP